MASYVYGMWSDVKNLEDTVKDRKNKEDASLLKVIHKRLTDGVNDIKPGSIQYTSE